MRKLTFAAALLLAVTACASASPRPASDRDVIHLEEIQAARTPNWFAWDLISSLRPHFLKSQSAVTLTEREPVFAVVYVDDIYHGELETLKSLRLDKILSVQFLPPFDAKTRFGQDMPGGAILIRTL